MLLYSIKNKGAFMQAMNSISFFKPQQQQQHMPSSAIDDVPIRDVMTKLEFNKYLDDKVRNVFKAGDLVTFSYTPSVKGSKPFVMKITYIEEVYSMCKYSNFRKQPRILTCLNGMDGAHYVSRTIGEVRHLTQEELNSVNLQNSNPHCC